VKAVILAGGLGSRLREETEIRPKPLIDIGGRPILWHILKIYSHFGVNDFVICLGYKGYMIKEYFANYALHMSNVTFDMATGERSVHRNNAEPWRVTLVDTGDETMTGGRLLRVKQYVGDEDFCLTYGDGVGDVDIGALIAFHRHHGKDATMTAVQPPARFGALEIGAENNVTRFEEKPIGEGSRINGGYFVVSPNVFQTIQGDETIWERGPLEQLSASGQLKAYRHDGFWHPMDTMRDKLLLESLWSSPRCPWKVWR
jgi:glucose-1-phosphate cytidylyltransferase